ncbi:dual specificity protein phosphatase 19 isoform X2 [Petromyzon marinus]|uniref:Dual specificity protein phosphatase 19 n=2 Tax=Petromyzon marinus TaxID=7757 RepID=A0AAJ7WMQ9_PETMA|nr:dual specificity protein phosphatase 19 [Petromyzon marinus]
MEPSLLADIAAFARGSLRPQRTRVTTPGGLSYTEGPGGPTRGGSATPRARVTTPGGLSYTEGPRGPTRGAEARGGPGGRSLGFVPDWSVDLQVGVVKPWLLLGSQDVAQDIRTLQQHKVSHILNVAYGVDNAFPDSYIYKIVTMLDVPDTKLTNYFPECFDFISRAHKQGGVVLVHCNAGVSRAASVIIGYLIQEDGLSFQDAFSLVKRARPAAHPNSGFMQQLSEYNPCQQGQRGES